MRDVIATIAVAVLLPYLIFLTIATLSVSGKYECNDKKRRIDVVFPYKELGCWLKEEID